MAPALDLRLRQHLALTPQLQQALRLLQLSALEFAQEMGEALGVPRHAAARINLPRPIRPLRSRTVVVLMNALGGKPPAFPPQPSP